MRTYNPRQHGALKPARHQRPHRPVMFTVSSADTLTLLEAFLLVFPKKLAKENILEPGEPGSFHLTALLNEEDNPGDVGRRI